MTNQEIANEIALVSLDQLPDLINKIYDTLDEFYSDEGMKDIQNILLTEGVDVTGLCKKKHPPAPH